MRTVMEKNLQKKMKLEISLNKLRIFKFNQSIIQINCDLRIFKIKKSK